jgi:hypothetical protein
MRSPPVDAPSQDLVRELDLDSSISTTLSKLVDESAQFRLASTFLQESTLEMNRSLAASRRRQRERGGMMLDAGLTVASLTLVALGAFHLLGDLMNDELEVSANRNVLAFTEAEVSPDCQEGWDLVAAAGRRANGLRIDSNGDRLVCEKTRRFRPDHFTDNNRR